MAENISDMVRMGIVSTVDAETRTVRVYSEQDDMVGAPLGVIGTPAPWLPAPGDRVLCLYLPRGEGDGFIIGRL